MQELLFKLKFSCPINTNTFTAPKCLVSNHYNINHEKNQIHPFHTTDNHQHNNHLSCNRAIQLWWTGGLYENWRHQIFKSEKNSLDHFFSLGFQSVLRLHNADEGNHGSKNKSQKKRLRKPLMNELKKEFNKNNIFFHFFNITCWLYYIKDYICGIINYFYYYNAYRYS